METPSLTALTVEHVVGALRDLSSGIKHPFHESTGYDLIWEGQRFSPKAVVGVAGQYAFGRMLRPDEFSGGNQPGQANEVLRRLGFEVVAKAGRDWSEDEVRVLVADYFAMLRMELAGEPYSKTEHRNSITKLLDGRSDGAIEFKHQNVSAVLMELELPFIEGYKPRGNYQASLGAGIAAYFELYPEYLGTLQNLPNLNPTDPQPIGSRKPESIEVSPPASIPRQAPAAKPWATRKVRAVDFVASDAANRQLGKLGEQFVLEFERARLIRAGRSDLATQIQWVANDIGDGLGFDILSFDERDGTERLIEVKTTAMGIEFPFLVTQNEVACSEDVLDRYFIYRVFDFGGHPQLYVLRGSLRVTCSLGPTAYRAVPVTAASPATNSQVQEP